jgi:hypothetical protein
VSLAYSPEFAPALDPKAGERRLAALAEATGGRVEPPVSELFAGSRASGGVTDLTLPLALLALLLLLAEIAVRRLDLPIPGVAGLAARRRRLARPVPAAAGTPGPVREAAGTEPPEHPEAATPPAVQPGLAEALERAKSRARQRST